MLQTQQLYAHMDTDLKVTLRDKLDAIAPEYGLLDLVYPSFVGTLTSDILPRHSCSCWLQVRCHGYATPPVSAADAVDGLSSLLDAATGLRIEVEVDGARHGGEWFGGGKVWHANGRWNVDAEDSAKPKEGGGEGEGEDVQDEEEEDGKRISEFTKNFWNAFDALSEYVSPSLSHVIAFRCTY